MLKHWVWIGVMAVILSLTTVQCGVVTLTATNQTSAQTPTLDTALCDLEPMQGFRLQLEEVKVSGKNPNPTFTLRGEIADIQRESNTYRIVIKPPHYTLRLKLPLNLELPLRVGQKIRWEYTAVLPLPEGGQKAAVVIRDEQGPLLVASDGLTLPGREWGGFLFEQEDAGCRNRRNEDGDMNNFWLRVSYGGEATRLMHGQQGVLADYQVAVFWSVAAVGDVEWTDAPDRIITYLIYRE